MTKEQHQAKQNNKKDSIIYNLYTVFKIPMYNQLLLDMQISKKT